MAHCYLPHCEHQPCAQADDDNDDDGPRTCCMCRGQLCYLGTLGKLAWYVCRACGMQQTLKG